MYKSLRYVLPLVQCYPLFPEPYLVPDIHRTLYLLSAPLYCFQYKTTGQMMMMMMIKIAPCFR